MGSWGNFPCIRGDAREYATFYAMFQSYKRLGGYTYSSDSGNLRRWGNLFADITSIVPEADMIPKLKNMTAESFSDIVTEDNHGLSFPSYHTFNSLLAALSPQLTGAYLDTRIAQCRPCESSVHMSCI